MSVIAAMRPASVQPSRRRTASSIEATTRLTADISLRAACCQCPDVVHLRLAVALLERAVGRARRVLERLERRLRDLDALLLQLGERRLHQAVALLHRGFARVDRR